MRAGVDPNATREFYPSLQPYFRFYEFIVQVITSYSSIFDNNKTLFVKLLFYFVVGSTDNN